jgi:5-carboxymethyl-2-hydroxymuconate isomerase
MRRDLERHSRDKLNQWVLDHMDRYEMGDLSEGETFVDASFLLTNLLVKLLLLMAGFSENEHREHSRRLVNHILNAAAAYVAEAKRVHQRERKHG